MISLDSPNYAGWLAVLAGRDNGVLLVAALAGIAVLWLCYARFWYPGAVPALRRLLLYGFYLSLWGTLIFTALKGLGL